MKCKRCSHLQACAENYMQDLYGSGYFDEGMYDCDVKLIDEYDMLEEFLKEAKKHKCTRAFRKTMDLIDPKISKRQ